MNNNKQKVYSVLDSITSTELEEYLNNRKINNDFGGLFKRFKEHRKERHSDKILDIIQKDFSNVFDNTYKFGEAWVIAFVLECFYDDKYKIKDLQTYLKGMIDQDETLKEYVYELMKDF